MKNNFEEILGKIRKEFKTAYYIGVISFVLLVISVSLAFSSQSFLFDVFITLSLLVLAYGYYYLYNKLEEKKKELQARASIKFSGIYDKLRNRIFHLVIWVGAWLLASIAMFLIDPNITSGLKIFLFQNIQIIFFVLLPASCQAVVSLGFLKDSKTLIDEVARNEKELKDAGLM
jgi:hypothetical protein